ncbi:hypothetical protein ZWY2020_041954 [Hordeum vulgare]|nr:hypothetical protein ZWY2020_041954 [Hordeum vulgare]
MRQHSAMEEMANPKARSASEKRVKDLLTPLTSSTPLDSPAHSSPRAELGVRRNPSGQHHRRSSRRFFPEGRGKKAAATPERAHFRLRREATRATFEYGTFPAGDSRRPSRGAPSPPAGASPPVMSGRRRQIIASPIRLLEEDFTEVRHAPPCRRLARTWLNSLPAGSVNSWVDFEEAFVCNFTGTYKHPGRPRELAICVQKADEPLRDYVTRWTKLRNSCERVHEVQAIQYFIDRCRDGTLLKHKLMCAEPTSLAVLMAKADKYATANSAMRIEVTTLDKNTTPLLLSRAGTTEAP